MHLDVSSRRNTGPPQCESCRRCMVPSGFELGCNSFVEKARRGICSHQLIAIVKHHPLLFVLQHLRCPSLNCGCGSGSLTMLVRTVLLALGSNMRGAWGSPAETFAHAQRALSSHGVRVLRVSPVYSTAPIGHGRQARYLNAVMLIDAPLAPASLLRLVKRLERDAGRRLGQHWGPRPLDIDILDHGGRRLGWPPRDDRRRQRFILPHPELHQRAFVLVPLIDVAPAWWRHPVLGLAASTLLARLPAHARAGVRRQP